VHFNPTYANKIKQSYLDMMDFNLTNLSKIMEKLSIETNRVESILPKSVLGWQNKLMFTLVFQTYS
jgi:hypothetical protein